jgi:hypothetical protein
MRQDLKTYYGSSLIQADDLPKIRSSGQFNPPNFFPLTESQSWQNIKFPQTDYKAVQSSEETRLKDYACRPLDQSAYFNQRAFKSTENALLQLFFSEINIKYIQERVRDEILKLRGQPISTEMDYTNLQNLMQETFTLAYQGKMPQFITDGKICNLKNLISDLNKQVINRYITHAVSTIDMHKYYISDITTLPVPLEIPIFTSTKGSNVVSQQVGLGTVEEFNRDIREWNNRFFRFKN